MIVFIDRQHSGKPNKIADRGAGIDINQDGKIGTDEMEAVWTARIGIELEIVLMDMGIQVLPISDGTYQARHKRVNDYVSRFQGHKLVYLALHLNAGFGDYGSFFYHYASLQGKKLAEQLADSLGYYVPDIRKTKAISCRKDDWTKNAFYTIRGVGRPVAICCEPFFMDTHSELLNINSVKQVALGMAKGIQTWGGK